MCAIRRRRCWRRPCCRATGSLQSRIPRYSRYCRRIDVSSGADTSGTGHILHNDSRMTRDMLAEVLGEQPGVKIVAAAWPKADDDVDGISLVEILLVRRRWRRDQRRG